MKELFLLEPDVVFLNHGSFGATPKQVFEAYQQYQLQLERQPVRFFVNEASGLMDISRRKLADFLGTNHTNLALISNATTAVNTIARSLHLTNNDEVLSCSHEYGALTRMWNILSEKQGFTYREHLIDYYLESENQFIERFWADVRKETKVIFLSHITSPSAIVLPIAEICKRARAAGILTIIDGAHAPGQIPLNLDDLNCDYYTGNCHKWLLSAKGSAFMYVSDDRIQATEPLVISWGKTQNMTGTTLLSSEIEYQGTRDIAALLSIGDAVDFYRTNNWSQKLNANRHLLYKVRTLFGNLFNTPPIADQLFMPMMYAQYLPESVNPQMLKQTLLEKYNIEIPVTTIGYRNLIRVSVQAYTNETDIHTFETALNNIFHRIVKK